MSRQATKSLDTSTSCISRTLAEQSLVGVLLATGLSGVPCCCRMQGSAASTHSSCHLHLVCAEGRAVHTGKGVLNPKL